MTKAVLGRYSATQFGKESTLFASDALWIPHHDIIGIASSYHHYHLMPISERDVMAAFDIVSHALPEHKTLKIGGTELLKELLQTVHRGFARINLADHVDGIEFVPTGVPDFPEPAEDPESEPIAQMVLLQLQKRRLSISSVGNFLVYLMRSKKPELVFGWDWFNNVRMGGIDDFPGPYIIGDQNSPKIYSLELDVQLEDLILVTTYSLSEIITLAKLDQLKKTTKTDLQAINHRIMSTLQSIVPVGSTNIKEPHKTTKGNIIMRGAAWAVVSVE